MRVWLDRSLPEGEQAMNLVAEVASFDPLPGEAVQNVILRRSRKDEPSSVLFDLVWFGPPLSEGASSLLVCLATAFVSLDEGSIAKVTRIVLYADVDNDDAFNLLGQVHWFVIHQLGALPRVDFRTTDSDVLFQWDRTAPISGTFLLDDGEVEVYKLLGEPLPVLWDPARFAQWVLDRSDTVVLPRGEVD